MKVKGQLEWTDYLNANLLHLQPDPSSQLFIYIVMAFFSCAAVVGLVLIVGGNLDSAPGVLVFLGVAVLLVLWRYVYLPRHVRHLFSQQKELHLPFELDIDDAGIIHTNELGQVNRPWKMFARWKENRDLFVLYLSDIAILPIPKRFLVDPSSADMFRTLLQTGGVPEQVKRPANPLRTVVVILLVLVAISAIMWSVTRSTYPP
jgi:hypothetical protein